MEKDIPLGHQRVNLPKDLNVRGEIREAQKETQGGPDYKRTFQIPKLARKRLNEKAKILIKVIEEKRKKSLDIAIYLLKTIDEVFNDLHYHFNKHIENIESLIVKETLSKDELDAVMEILSISYLPDEDLRNQCKISIEDTFNAYKIKKILTTAVKDRTKEDLINDFGLLVEGPKERILEIVQTPNQKYFVSASSDNNITLWNYKQKYQEKVLQGHSKSVNCLAVSGDSKFIASGANDSTARLWSLNGRFKCKMIFTHEDIVSSIAIAKDKSYIVTGCFDKKVYIWNTFNKEVIKPFVGHEDIVLSVAIDNTMEIIASGSKDNLIRIWKKNDRTFTFILCGHTSQVNCVTFTPDNKYLISGSSDNTVRVWNYKENNSCFRLNGHTHPVLSVTVTSDSLYAISSSVDRTIRVWNLLKAVQEKIFMQKGPVRSICISSDDKYLMATENNLSICAWDLESNDKAWKIANHTSEIKKIAVSSDKSVVVTMSNNEFIVWNAYTREQEAVIDRINSRCIAVSEDGTFLALGLENQGIFVWNLAEKLLHLETFDHEGVVNCISIASKNGFIVSGSSDTKVILADLHNFTNFTIFTGHTGQVLCIAISSDNQLIVSGSADKTVIVWNIFKKKLQTIFKDHKEAVTCVAISSNTQHVFSGSEDKALRIWNLVDRKIEQVLNNISSPIKCLHLDNNEKNIAIGLKDSTILFVNIENIAIWYKRSFTNELKGHKGEIVNVFFCQNSELAISSSLDGTLKLWDYKKEKAIVDCIIPSELNYNMVYNNKTLCTYLLSQYGGVMVFSIEHKKMLNFEKIFDKSLVKSVIMAYPAIKKIIAKELRKEGIS